MLLSVIDNLDDDDGEEEEEDDDDVIVGRCLPFFRRCLEFTSANLENRPA